MRIAPNWRALGHPLTWAAVALMLINDHVLRPRWDNLFTGKLSDVAWLVLVPILLAAVAAPRSTRWAPRIAALCLTTAAYILLQSWAPLGDAFGTAHVADLHDLWALPAVIVPVLIWTANGTAVATTIALPVIVGTLVADSPEDDPPDTSWPCQDGTLWPTDEALVLRLSRLSGVDNDVLRRGISLSTESGADVPLVISVASDLVFVCAREGLEPETDYVWSIGDWEVNPSHELSVASSLDRDVRFRTDARAGVPVESEEDCMRLEPELPTNEVCDWVVETDTGWGDSG